MIKGILKHTNTHTQTEEIELPDTVNTGDIICLVYHAMGNFDYDDCMDMDKFEIVLEDERVYRCFRLDFNKFSLYMQEPGCDYELVANFRF